MKKSITIVMPVYNEEIDVPKNIPVLHKFLSKNMNQYNWEIVIADNASIDQTKQIGQQLTKKLPHVKYVDLERKGRGRALKMTWNKSKSEYLAYMDIDLSSDLNYFPKLINALEEGADIAIGSRLAKGAKVIDRPLLREVMSRGYSLMFRTLFFTRFKDAQCGFKAITKNAANKLLPVIRDTAWFFDSELLIIAQKSGYQITEVPITWKDDPNSTVKVAKTAWGDIKGMMRLLKTRPWKQLKMAGKRTPELVSAS
jgi:glycosyltransferase involved in cell wall biosynthesis